jgi:hypothetical protein
MKLMHLGFMTCLGLGVAGCMTGYQHTGMFGGYQDREVGPNTFEIHVDGNGFATAERVRNIALLRACQITLEHGASRFAIIDQDHEVHSAIRGYQNGSMVVTYDNSYLTTELVPDDTPGAFDAVRFAREFGPRLNYSGPTTPQGVSPFDKPAAEDSEADENPRAMTEAEESKGS